MKVPLQAPYEMAPGIVAGIHRTVVRVTTDDGVVGLGESFSPEDAALLRGQAGQVLLGKDSDLLRGELGRREQVPAAHRTDGRVFVSDPLAGVEIALWDVAAREAYLLGAQAIRSLVFDPWLPAPLVDIDARHAYVETVRRFDETGKDIWNTLYHINTQMPAVANSPQLAAGVLQ